MKKLKLFAVVALLLAMPGYLQAAQSWRTTHFEVFMGKPYEARDAIYTAALENNLDPDSSSDLCGFFGSETGCDQVIAELERFLHDLALAFQRDGFADPTLDTIDAIRVDENGRETVRVYLYDFGTDEPLAGFRNKCDGQGLRQLLELNSRGLFKNGRVSARGFQSAAHELFHAVQLASNFRGGDSACKYGQWITEGTADAVGFDYAKRLRNISFRNWQGDSVVKPWGIRQYFEPLNKRWSDGDSSGYQTMSFWRHLAEWNLAKKSGQDHPGSAETGTDYSYLVKLFATRQNGSGRANELTWLDSWMKSYKPMNVGLAPVYAQFVASLGDYGRNRLSGVTEIDKNKWPRGQLGDCPEIRLGRYSPRQQTNFYLNIAAARCVSVIVESDTYQPMEIVVQNSDLALEDQQQLSMGAVGGMLVASPDIRIAHAPAPDAGTSYAWWRFLVIPNHPNLFVISNMARPAGSTRAIAPIVHFSISEWDSSMTPQQAGSAGGQQREQPKSREAVKKYQKSLRSNPTTKSAMAAMSGSDFSPARPGCTDGLKSLNMCGPQLSISLSKDFGLVPGEGPVASTGGLLAQVGAQAMQVAEEADLVLNLEQMAANPKGQFVNLSIPLIRYGETGSFSNARIDVTGDIKEGIPDSYSAIKTTPVSVSSGSGGPGKVYPPNGTVTIVEYSPHILRGQFSATLVSKEKVKKANISRDNPVLPTSGSISGSFVVSAPWRGNGARPDASRDSNMMSGIRSDTMDLLAKVPESLRGSVGGSLLSNICKLGFEDEQLASLNISGSCSGAGGTAMQTPRCDCNCGNWEVIQTMPTCNAECDAKWQAWECGPYLQSGLGELDVESQQYQRELQQLGLSEAEVTSLTHTFMNSPPKLRAQMQGELDQYRIRQAEQDFSAELSAIETEQAERAERASNYDDETLRYQAALREAGYSNDEVSGMVEIFSPSSRDIRQVFWSSIENRTPENRQ